MLQTAREASSHSSLSLAPEEQSRGFGQKSPSFSACSADSVVRCFLKVLGFAKPQPGIKTNRIAPTYCGEVNAA